MPEFLSADIGPYVVERHHAPGHGSWSLSSVAAPSRADRVR